MALSKIPDALWIGAAGIGVAAGSQFMKEKNARYAGIGLGAVLIIVAVVSGLDDLLDYFGLGQLFGPKKKEGFSDVVTTDIEDVSGGGASSTGVVVAHFIQPLPGAALDKDNGTYEVQIDVASSMLGERQVHIEFESKEFYSFGSQSEGVRKNFGMVSIGYGERKTMKATIRFEASGPTNPFFPPEVSLTLFKDSAPVDNLRFSYE